MLVISVRTILFGMYRHVYVCVYVGLYIRYMRILFYFYFYISGTLKCHVPVLPDFTNV